MNDLFLPEWRQELEDALLARFRECVGVDRSVLIDPGEQAQLALDLLNASPLQTRAKVAA